MRQIKCRVEILSCGPFFLIDQRRLGFRWKPAAVADTVESFHTLNRRVSGSIPMLAKQLGVLFATLMVPMLSASAGQPQVGGTSRWASFDASGTSYFAVSVQPDARGSVPQPERHEIVLLVDTSASQTGPVRLESFEVMDEMLAGLPSSASIAIVACDVKAIALTKGLVTPGSPELAAAVDRLKNRVPLGTTNLSHGLQTALAQFASSVGAQRTIIYIGDGVNRKQFLSSQAYKELLAGMVGKQVTLSSFVIGPVVDVPTLSAMANQTGGVLFARNEISQAMTEVGRALAESIHAPVLWPTKVSVPKSLAKHLPVQFPPLRLDRDSVIIGEAVGTVEGGKLTVDASVAGQAVLLSWNLAPEASHPDMAFLPAACESAVKDEGRTLPALGSAGLRAMSYAMSDSSVSLVKSGQFALKSGEVQSAIRIAQEALKADPNNAEAISLLEAAKKQSKAPAGKFMSAQVPDDPFGTAPAAPASDPFGTTPAEPATPAPATLDAVPTAPANDPLPQPAAQANSDALAPVEGGVLDSRFLASGDLLKDEEAIRRVQSEALKSDLDRKLADADRKMGADPTGVKNSLLGEFDALDQANIDPGLRIMLKARLSAALERVSEREARYLDQQARNAAVRSQAEASRRLLDESARRETALKQLVESFNFLMSQYRYLEASQEIAPEIETLAPETPLAAVTHHYSSLFANQALVREAFRRREQGFVDSMRGAEEAAVPFAGEPPIVYPPADVWQALTAQRKERYGTINLAADDQEQRIYQALRQDFDADFTGTGLKAAMEQIADKYSIPIFINEKELDNLSVPPDSPITLNMKTTVRAALRLMLKPLDLTYVIRDGILHITSTDDANSDPINKIYPVGDLVVPPSSGGMMGGMMGGMGGGMMGGMGGMGMGGGMGGMGMGGMGGGMGGMGMGGMGGGMGGMGGMFAVPDQPTKNSASASSGKASVSGAQPAVSNAKLPLTNSTSVAKDWDDLVREYETADEKRKRELDAEVREMATSLVASAEKCVETGDEKAALAKFEQVIGLVNQMLRSGHPQPWMYHALSLSMRACKYPNEDVERVMLSSLDFGGGTPEAIDIARYFTQNKMKREALSLLRDTSIADPYSYEVYAVALPLARELNDLESLRWTCAGVLSKAWTSKYDKLADDARFAARATSMRLKQEGRVLEATAFENEIKEALRRDIVVRVSWTGQAEIGLRVKEPVGTVCSYNNPQTVSGGVLIGNSRKGTKDALGAVSEYYVCPQGYAGEYDILLRRIWGKVSGGKATVEILTDYGTPEQKSIVQQVDINEKDALFQVSVKNGHRKQPMAAADLANVRDRQISASRSVLGQFAGAAPVNGSSSSSGSSAVNPYAALQALLAGGGGGINNGFPFRGVVGYRPVIQSLPEGASMFATGVVSADRRYVRITPSPQFSQIGEIFTFNSVDGSTGGGQGTTGGTGGGAAGGGGFGNGGGGGVF